MDKKEAIRTFVKRYSSLLRQTPFPWEVYKRTKHSFFIDDIKCPSPKDSEIAADIVEGMIVSLQIKQVEDLDKILNLPFFDKTLLNKKYYYEKLDVKLKQSTPLLDVETLKNAEVAEKIRNELKSEVKKELMEEKITEFDQMDKKIQEKTEEYNSLPSILDGADYPFSASNDLKQKNDQVYVAWWDRMGLKEDPFKELEGLSRLDRSLFNKIIYKTSIFVKYESMLKNSLGEIFKNTVVYGEYGSGKTTFFDFMRSILDIYKIREIYIQLGGEFEVRELIFEFNKELSIELKKLCSIFIDESMPEIETLSDEDANVELMKKLTYKGAKGFVILIDDLHKGPIDKAMGFMSYLQVLTSRLRRATDLNIGFFVAGYLDWEDKINGSEKFSGSVHRQEHMPPLEVDVVLTAINRRLRVFAKNPENPRQIDKSLIEKIYRALEHNSQKITFRRVMSELVNEFELGHFDVLSANPIKISQETVIKIRIALDSDQGLRRNLDTILLNPTLMPIQKKYSLELLVRIYLSNGLLEPEIQEYDIPFLQKLKHSNLIIKTIDNGKSKWRIAHNLYAANQRVIKEYGLSLEDYLVKLFSDNIPDAIEPQKPMNSEINQIEQLESSFSDDLSKRLLIEAKKLHLKILETRDLDIADYPPSIIQDCMESLAKLTSAYMFYEKIRIPRRTNFERILFWKDFWWSPEGILQFCRVSTSSMEDKQKIALALALYRDVFPQIVNFFKNEYENSQSFFIPLSHLKNDEIKLLHECRHLLINKKYAELADMLLTAVDRKLKVFLYNIFTVLYGDYDSRIRVLDRESRANIVNKMQEFGSNLSLAKNEFQRLSPHNYCNLMTGVEGITEGKRNWRAIFSSVFVTWQEKDLYNFLNVVSSISHGLSKKCINSKDLIEDDVSELLKQSTTFTRSINRMYAKIITEDYFEQKNDKITFSLSPYYTDLFLQPIQVSEEDLKKVVDLFEGKKFLKASFDDQEYMEGFFGLNYRKIYSSLALLYRGLNQKGEKIDYQLQMLASKGPEIRATLNKAIVIKTTPAENSSLAEKPLELKIKMPSSEYFNS